MSYIKCMYKYNDICKQVDLPILMVEEEHNWKCLDNCIWQNPLWTKENCKELIFFLLKEMKYCTRKDYKHLKEMKFIYGHCSENEYDYDSISYYAITIKLIQLKQWKHMSDNDFCMGILLMKKLNIGISKSAKRRFRRIYKVCGNNCYYKDYFERDFLL